MKNIHVIPVDKEPVKGDLLLRHIWKGEPNECISWWRYNDTTMYGDTLVYTTLNGSFMDVPSSFKVQNIYITSDEEIKESDSYLDITDNTIWKNEADESMNKTLFPECKKIILTTDQDLIKDGVQAIDDEFLEWFVKNPSCEFVDVEKQMLCDYCGQEDCDNLRCNGYKDSPYYEIIIPQEEPKQDTVGKVFFESADKTITVYRQETVEKAAEKYAEGKSSNFTFRTTHIRDFSAGAKWQQEQDKKMYSEEEVIFFIKEAINYPSLNYNRVSVEDWFKQFKKE